MESLLGFDLEEAEAAIDQAKRTEESNDALQSFESSLKKIHHQMEIGSSVRRNLLGAAFFVICCLVGKPKRWIVIVRIQGHRYA